MDLSSARGPRSSRPSSVWASSSWTRSTTRRTSRTRRRGITAATSPIVRGRGADALVVLGSATPSLETYAQRRDRPVRAGRACASVCSIARWPTSPIVDMREEYAAEGPRRHPQPRVWRRRSASGSRAGEQSLLLLNRRGFATAVFCRQCGHILDCPNCSVSLTVHRRAHGPARAVCHYCNYSVRVPTDVREMRGAISGAGRLRHRAGRGRSAGGCFPTARVGPRRSRHDAGSGALARVLARFGARELDMLVGTQMIAKGHDFPARHAGRRRSRRTSGSASPTSARPSGRSSC